MNRTYVIAEVGVNHNGSVDTACRLIDEACRIGADAAKFQHFVPASLVAHDAPTAVYQRTNDGADKQMEMLSRLAFSDDQLARVNRYCAEKGIDFLCTPFDMESAAFVVGLGPRAVKIGSGDITFDRMLRYVASSGIPMIVSTGMANLSEIAHACDVIRREQLLSQQRESGFPPLSLLQCTSNYPTALEDVHLATMASLRDQFSVPVGFSDHTTNSAIAAFAVSMGATIVEKHLTLDRSSAGPDHAASLEPGAFADMVDLIRQAEAVTGSGEKRSNSTEVDVAKVARRSLFVAKDVPAGKALEREDLVMLRPGTGIPPTEEENYLGRTIDVDLKAFTLLKPEHFRN